MQQLFLIDGLNFLHGQPHYRLERGISSALERFADDLAVLASAGQLVIAVIDGGAAGPLAETLSHSPFLTFVHTVSGQSADAAIVGILKKIRGRMGLRPAVISDDRALGVMAQSMGAETISIASFAGQLFRRREGQRIYLRRRQREISWGTLGDAFPQLPTIPDGASNLSQAAGEG
jgi:predicted RNA-binding protein with PIN domain